MSDLHDNIDICIKDYFCHRKIEAFFSLKIFLYIIDNHLSSLVHLGAEFKNSKKYILCLEKRSRALKDVRIMNWMEGIEEIFEL